MAGRAALRASDADRERVIERLRRAAAEGRLRTEELEHRVGAALAARTYGQLEALLHDLPGPRLLAHRRRRGLTLPKLLGIAIAVPILVAAVALVAQLVVGAVAVWALWVAAGWLFFGRRGRRYGPWGGWRGGSWGGWHGGCGPWRGRSMRMSRHSRTYWA